MNIKKLLKNLFPKKAQMNLGRATMPVRPRFNSTPKSDWKKEIDKQLKKHL